MQGYEWILRWFWFLSVPMGLANTLLARSRLAPKFSEPLEEREALDSFLRSYFIYTVAPFVLLGGLQLAGGHPSPFFIMTRDFGDWTVLGSWIVLSATWIGLIWWVWMGGGAETLYKYRDGLNVPPNPRLIRLLTLVIVAGAVIALLLGRTKVETLREYGMLKEPAGQAERQDEAE